MATQASDEYYRPYRDYAWRFRIWLVAFGVSAPIALLSNSTTYSSLKTSCAAKAAIWLLFAGVLIQISLTWLYKWCMWVLYMSEIGQIQLNDERLKLAHKISCSFAIEFILDLTTVLFFLISSVILLIVLL
jgi:hypothetical protein